MRRNRKRHTEESWEGFTLGELRCRERFDEFVSKAYGRLLSFAYQLLRNWDDANDVLQTVFLELWELVTKRLKQPDAKALSFAYLQIRRRALSVKSTVPAEPIDEAGQPDGGDFDLSERLEDEMADIEGIVIAIEKRDAIYKCGEQLRGRAKEVFSLLAQGFSQAEIAEALGISRARVSQLVDIVYVQLKRRLQDMGYECNETIDVPLIF